MSIIKFISSIFSISSSLSKKSSVNSNGNNNNLTQYSNDRVSCVGALGLKSDLGLSSLYSLGGGRCGDGFAYGRSYY